MTGPVSLLPSVTSSVPKAFRLGTHRAIPPGDTLDRVRPFLRALGITRIANVTGLDRIGIPVVMACRPNSRSVAVAQGKGLDLAAAKASAVMESIETHHAERITLPLKLGSYDDLRSSHRQVDVARLPRPKSSAFHPHLPLLWIEGYDLLQQEHVWVPYELVHTNYTLPQPTGSGCFLAYSNGLAAGNHLLEAISHAICEVVERDATTLWHLLPRGAREATRVDLATVDDPACRDLLARYERAGIAVAVWETTSDIGLPAFQCTIADDASDPLHPEPITRGTGCHPAREIALLRALTEAAQSRLTLIAGARDDLFRGNYARLGNPDWQRRMRALLAPSDGARYFHDAPTFDGESLEADVAWELDLLRAVGINQVVVVDLTQPAYGIPVARVIVPRLEGLSEIAGYVHGARAGALAARQRGLAGF